MRVQIGFICSFALAAVVLGAINCRNLRKNCYSTLPKESYEVAVPDFPKEDENMLWAVLVFVCALNIYAFCFSAYCMCKIDECRCTCTCNWFITLAALNIVVAVLTLLIESLAVAIVHGDCKAFEIQDTWIVIEQFDDKSSTSVLLILALCLTVVAAIFTIILQYYFPKYPQLFVDAKSSDFKMNKMPLL
jgi:hypothetical protein